MFSKKGKIAFSVLMALFASAVLTPVFSGQKAKKPPSPVPVLSTTLLNAMGIPAGKRCVFVLKDSIKLLDAKTFLMFGPYLKGQLGTAYLMDVVLTKNGKTAILSNLLDKRIFIVNLSNISNPKVLGSVTLGFEPCDIALSPNQKYAVIAGGEWTRKLAVIDVKKRFLIQELDLTSKDTYALAVEIAKDNQTVVTTNYYGRKIDYFNLNPKTGALNYVGGRSVSGATPVNVAISPDGKTVFAVNWVVDPSTRGFGLLYSITAPGTVVLTQRLGGLSTVSYGHDAVFSKDGKKLYVLGGSPVDADGKSEHRICIYNVSEPGRASYSGISIILHDFTNITDQMGVDTMALEPGGRFLFVSNDINQTSAENRIAVVDLRVNAHVLSLIACANGDYPMGIAFKSR